MPIWTPRSIVLTAILLVLLPIVGRCQLGQTPIAFDHLTAEDGLSHNTVYTILQDRYGLIWLGTRYGLNRYDGYECKVFLPIGEDENSLNTPTVMALLEDRSGKIWVGHREGGISILDQATGKFERFPNDPKLAGVDWRKETVRGIYEDKKGQIWIATTGQGVFVFDEKRQLADHFCTSCEPKSKAISNDFVFDFVEDQNGTVWIATDGHGLNGYDTRTKSTFTVHSNDPLDLNSFEKSLCLDQKGNLWVGTAGSGLYRYDIAKQQFTHFFHDKNNPNGLAHALIRDVAVDSAGQVWIGTDGAGLDVFEPKTGLFRHIRSTASYPQALNSEAIYRLLFDRIGNLWVGTFNGGVNIRKAFSPPFFIHENQNEYRRLGLRSVLALAEGDGGKVWIGTDGGGLFFTEKMEKSIDLQRVSAVSTKVVTCLKMDRKDGIWIGSFANGLTYLNAKTGQTRNFRRQVNNPNSLSHDNVWDLELAPDGGLWIGTLGGGVDYLPHNGSSFKRFLPVPGDANSLSSVQVVDVLLDQNGKYLWAATEDQGLNRLDLKTFEIKRYDTDGSGLNCNNLQCLLQDPQGKIWIGTEFKGINCLDPATGTVQFFDTSDGLPSNMVNGIVADERGLLWVSTQKGIVRWDPATSTAIDFGTDDNLRNNQYNPRASLRLSDGRLLFGGTNGFSIIAPNSLRSNPFPPDALFTGLRIAGQAVPIGNWNGRSILDGNLNDSKTTIHLSYADRGIIFEFSGTDYTDPSKNKFAYKLDGFDEHWNNVGAEQHRAVYSSLKGGTYKLRLKASNSDNLWGEERVLNIVVSPPFWERWWFILLCIAVAIGLAFLINQFSLEHQKAVFQEKSFKSEQEIMRLKNENLEKEVEANQSRLSASVLQSAHKNQFLADLKSQVQKLETQSPELRKVVRAIDSELNQEDYWEQFQITFNQAHQEFVQQLEKSHPDITSNEVRLCCFIRMGMSNSEIATVLNITVNGVEQSKYRLKRKLALEKEASLNEYIRSL